MRTGFASLLVIFGLIATVVAVFLVSYLQFSRSPIEVVKGKLNSKEVFWSSDSRKYTQLSISDDTLYALSSDGNIYAIDPISGKEKGNIKINGSIEHNFYLYKDYIYYASSVENNPKPTSSRILYAVNAETGQEVWRKQIQSYVTKLKVIDNVLYYALHEEQKLFALNSSTGDLLWSIDIYVSASGNTVLEAEDGITLVGIPAPDNQSPGNKLHALDSVTGKILWSFPATSNTSADSASILVVDEIVYLNFTDYSSRPDADFLYALALKTGEVKWKINVEGNPHGGLAVNQNKIFLSKNYSYVYAVDKATGKELWKIKAKDGQNHIKSFPNALYLVNNQDGAELAPYYGNLSNIDLETGNVNWEFEKNRTTFSRLEYLDDIVFVISRTDGKIYALR